jgi:hypothetical protein
LSATTSNFDYGTFDYPQFHDPILTELRLVSYYFDVTLLTPGTMKPVELSQVGSIFSAVAMTPAPTDPIVPVLGPPTAPLINGEDAFAPHSGVGLQPVLSWSPPDLGTASSYGVSINDVDPPEEGDRIPSASVYSGTSFKVPPGFLRPGHRYWAQIFATQADFDVLDRPPFREGTSSYTTNCVVGIFTP